MVKKKKGHRQRLCEKIFPLMSIETLIIVMMLVSCVEDARMELVSPLTLAVLMLLFLIFGWEVILSLYLRDFSHSDDYYVRDRMLSFLKFYKTIIEGVLPVLIGLVLFLLVT